MPDEPDLSFPYGPQFGEVMGRVGRDRRRALGLSPEGVADRCGFEWAYVLELEGGVHDLGVNEFWLWARALEIDVVEFSREVTDLLLVENPWYAEAVRRGRMNWMDDEPPD